jgi:hypothetical protein
MKAIAAILGSLVLVLGIQQQLDATGPAPEDAAGVQWEYLIVSGASNVNLSAPDDKYRGMRKAPDSGFGREAFVHERHLDKLGEKGWELVSVFGSQQDPTYYLKRPKR